MEFWTVSYLFQVLYSGWSWTRDGWQYSAGEILGVQIDFHLILGQKWSFNMEWRLKCYHSRIIPLDLVRLFIFDISPKTRSFSLINYYKYSPYPTGQKHINASKETRQPVLSSISLSLACSFWSFNKPSFLLFRLGGKEGGRVKKKSQVQINENGKISVEKSRWVYPKLDCLLVSLGQIMHVPTVSSPSLCLPQAKDSLPEVSWCFSCSPSTPHLFSPPGQGRR